MDPAPLPSSDVKTNAIADTYDPSEEYRKLLELTDPSRRLKDPKSSIAKGPSDFSGRLPDTYQYLMSRERRVLDTVDRVVNDSIVKDESERTLFGMPVHELTMRTVGSVRALIDDLISARNLSDVSAALSDPRRRPYLGVAMVAIALILASLQCM
jgi:hypothetical protein